MNWRDANDFFSMGGNGLYVWGAYGVMALLMLVEPVLVMLRHRAACASAVDRAAAADLEAAEATRGGATGARP